MIKSLTDGLLEREIVDITSHYTMPPDAIQYECYLHTENVDVKIDILLSVEVLRDYKNNIADFIIVGFLFPMGDYIIDIVPFSDNLEMTIKLKFNGKRISSRYKAVLLNFTGGVANSMYDGMSRDDMNTLEKAIVEVQCLDRVVEILRTLTVEKVLNYTTVDMAIKYSLIEALDTLKVDGQPIPVHTSVVKPHNDTVYRHIQIPYNVNVLDIPSYLQNTDYGVYNTDIGTYFQTFGLTSTTPADSLYVYDLLDNTRFDTDERKLLIIASNTKKYEFVENTFKLDGPIIKVLASSVKNLDTGDKDAIDVGNAIVTLDPSSMIQGNKLTTTKKTMSNPKVHMTGKKSYSKRDGVNKPVIVNNKKNAYKARSELLAKQRAMFQFVWRFCNVDLIQPGMAVGYSYYSKKFGVVTLKGVVVSLYVKYSEDNKTNVAVINTMLESPISWEYEQVKKNLKKAGANYGF